MKKENRIVPKEWGAVFEISEVRQKQRATHLGKKHPIYGGNLPILLEKISLTCEKGSLRVFIFLG